MTRVAEELRQPAQLWMLAAAQATLALSQGRFAEAPELIERAAAIGERVLTWSAAAARKMQLFLLRREQGRLDGFVREVRDHAHEFPSPLVHRAVLAHVYARLGAHRRGGGPPPRAHEPRPLGLARRRGVARQHLPARGDLRNPRRHRARRSPLRAPPALRLAQCRRRPRARARLHQPAARHPRDAAGPLRGRGATTSRRRCE